MRTGAEPASARETSPPGANEEATSVTREVSVPPPLTLPPHAPTLLVHLEIQPGARTTLPRVVFLHGYSACIRALADQGPTSCGQGLPTQPGWGLTAAADSSGESYALLLPQFAFLRRDGAVGRWARHGEAGRALQAGLRQAWDDAGRGALPAGPWVVIAHSGGFKAAAVAVDGGELPAGTVVLLDALYEAVPRFGRWLVADPNRRLISVHRSTGTPARRTRALSRRVRRELGADRVAETSLAGLAEALETHRLITIEVPTAHADIPGRYLGEILRAILPDARRREADDEVARAPVTGRDASAGQSGTPQQVRAGRLSRSERDASAGRFGQDAD